jgi:hypothetical protein
MESDVEHDTTNECLTQQLQQNLSIIIMGAHERKLHLDDKQDKIVEQENFVFDLPARCFWGLRHRCFGLVHEATIE